MCVCVFRDLGTGTRQRTTAFRSVSSLLDANGQRAARLLPSVRSPASRRVRRRLSWRRQVVVGRADRRRVASTRSWPAAAPAAHWWASARQLRASARRVVLVGAAIRAPMRWRGAGGRVELPQGTQTGGRRGAGRSAGLVALQSGPRAPRVAVVRRANAPRRPSKVVHGVLYDETEAEGRSVLFAARRRDRRRVRHRSRRRNQVRAARTRPTGAAGVDR